jgi:hypothetical protein
MGLGGLELEMPRSDGHVGVFLWKEVISWYVLCCCVYGRGGEDVNGGCDRAWKYLR